MLTPFEAGKNAKELGIDFTREFVVVKPRWGFTVGEVVKVFAPESFRRGAGIRDMFVKSNHRIEPLKWEHLAYAPLHDVKDDKHAIQGEAPQSDVSPEKHALREEAPLSSPTEGYKPQVGDVISVRVEGRVAEVVAKDNVYKVSLWAGGFLWLDTRQTSEEATLISRKAKRKVTMEEIRKLFGEDVEIV